MMKRIIFLLVASFGTYKLQSQGVVITNNVDTIVEQSAILELRSNDKGFILPRMSSVERNDIIMPIAGLVVFDTDDELIYVYTNTNWISLGKISSLLSDEDGDTQINVESIPDEDIIRFRLEGTEAMILDRNANMRHRINQNTNGFNTLIGHDVAQGGIGARNVAIGHEVGEMSTNFADDNVFIGYWAGQNTEGDQNVFVGSRAGQMNTSGYDNTFIGHLTGTNNTTGHSNTFLGRLAGRANTIGFGNTAIGTRAGHGIVDVNYNTFVGYSSGYATTSGENNVAIGFRAAYANSTGDFNTVIGTEAGGNVLSNRDMGNGNTLVGYRTAYSMNGSSNNTIVGNLAASFLTVGGGNSIFGSYAGRFLNAGENNTFLGTSAGQSTVVGNENVFVGFNAGFGNYYGNNNLAFGTSALLNNYDGNHNIAIGDSSLQSNEGGHGNIAIGQNALTTFGSMYDQSNNIAIGNGAGSQQRGDDNIYIGSNVAQFNSDVTGSLFIGKNAGTGTLALGLGDNNTLIGANTGFSNSVNNIANATAIGTGATIALSNSVIIGDPDQQLLQVGIGTDQPNAMLGIDAYSNSFYPLRISQEGQQRFIVNHLGNVRIGEFQNTSVHSSHLLGVDGILDVFDDAFIRGQLKVGYDDNGYLNTDFLLGVKGKAIMEEVWVRQENDWPDYVFTPEYNLKPINELDEYIQKNKHLPNIPSADEIADVGQNVGENQRLLLEKIEELTLYVIALQKEVNQLKASQSK